VNDASHPASLPRVARNEVGARSDGARADLHLVRPEPTVAPLTPDEAQHYRWLFDGISRGLRERAADRGDDVAVRAHEVLVDLFDELLARVEPATRHTDDVMLAIDELRSALERPT
jgi:hypothetical protein